MNKFITDLENDSLIERPRSIHRTACLVWNAAGAGIPAWPKEQLTVPDYRDFYVLSWTTFPPSLKTELDAYLARLGDKDPLAEHDFRPLRATSIATRLTQIREFISAAVHGGHDPQALTSLADLVALDTVQQGVGFIRDRSGKRTTRHVHQIICAIKAMAQHWVKVDEAHLKRLQLISRRANPGRPGMTSKNQDRLRQFNDQVNVDALLTLPDRILAKMPSGTPPSYKQALEVQTAVAIGILLMIPMRLRNLKNLNMDDHLIRTRASGVVHLAVKGSEVKNEVNIEALLPTPTIRLLDEYFQRYRPVLVRNPSPWVFPGETDKGPKTGLGAQISKYLKKQCGLLVNPHLFRHIGAMLYLLAHPGAYGVIRLVHGHKSVETTTQFYCGMESTAAMRHFDEHILKLRDQATPPPVKRPSRSPT
jgi:integrase